MPDRRLEPVDEPRGTQDYEGLVPPPIPPDDPEAWYARKVQAQYEVAPEVVVTIEHHGDEFTDEVREPVLTARGHPACPRFPQTRIRHRRVLRALCSRPLRSPRVPC